MTASIEHATVDLFLFLVEVELVRRGWNGPETVKALYSDLTSGQRAELHELTDQEPTFKDAFEQHLGPIESQLG